MPRCKGCGVWGDYDPEEDRIRWPSRTCRGLDWDCLHEPEEAEEVDDETLDTLAMAPGMDR